jgi:hypothetical protein
VATPVLLDAEFGHDILELQVNGEPARAAAFLAEGRGVLMTSENAVYGWFTPRIAR